jgi:hypothetical protein
MPRNHWLKLIGVACLMACVGCRKPSASDPDPVNSATPDPLVLQQRAVAEARVTLNAELLPDDGTFFPATGDIEVGSLLYTIHVLGPAKERYYCEDAYLAAREKDLFIVRPILERAPPGASPASYRSRQARSAETKREEVKAQKKITLAELTEKYAARTSP